MRAARARLDVVLAVVVAAWLLPVGACTTATAPVDRADACRGITDERSSEDLHHLRGERRLMGTSFEIRVVTDDPVRGCVGIDAAFAEVAREEALFSEYQDTSDISAINHAAGGAAVEVDPEVFSLITRAMWASQVTGGAFDITYAACGHLWSIRERRVPDAASVDACLDQVGYRLVNLDSRRSTVLLPKPGMRIGLGGIAKGYGVDRAVAVLNAHGLTRVAVNGGGDLRVEGTDLDGPWTVQIAHPRRLGEIFDVVPIGQGAIVTSGDYMRFFEQDGVRYHHIVDPATGWPARRSVAVTVVAPTATDADALATGLFVLGPERGLAVAASLPGVEALFFGPDLRVHATPGFPRGRSRLAAAGPVPMQ